MDADVLQIPDFDSNAEAADPSKPSDRSDAAVALKYGTFSKAFAGIGGFVSGPAELLNYLRLEKPRVASMLSQCGGAGTGCGWCIPFLKQLHSQAQEGGDTELEILAPEEYARRRAVYIREGHGVPPPGATPLPEDCS